MLVRWMQWFICCLLLCTSLGLPSPAHGKELNSAAYLQNVEGEVMVQKGGGLREFRALEGMLIQQGDRVRTSIDSSVQIHLTDTREVVLGQTSQLFISELTEARTTVKLLAGEIWNKIASNEEQNYRVETSSIIVNVQGALFHVHADRNLEATTVRVWDGELEVKERGFANKLHVVQAFEQFISKSGSLGSLSDPLDLHSFMQETHASIVFYILQDLLATAQLREQQSIINAIRELAENANIRLPALDRWGRDMDEEHDYEDIEEVDESEEPKEPKDQHHVWLEENVQGTSLLLRFNKIPSNQAIVALQVHLELEGEESGELSAFVNDIPVASTFFAGQEEKLVRHRDGIHFSDRGMELILAQMLFGDGLVTGYDVQNDEMITIEMSHSRLREMEPWKVRIIDVILVDVDGNLIEPLFDQEWISIEGGQPRE